MLKNMLLLGALSTSALLSAGYWDVLNDDVERAAKIALLTEEDHDALQKACSASDAWREESQASIAQKANDHQKGFVVMKEVLGAQEIRAHSELVCIISDEETRAADEVDVDKDVTRHVSEDDHVKNEDDGHHHAS